MVNPRILIIGGVGAGGGFYLYHKHRVAAVAATDASATDPNAAVDPSLSDPNAYGGYSPAYSSGGSGVLSSYYDPSTGTTIGGVGGQVITAPTTNSQWLQQALGFLTSQGFDPTAAVEAISKYITTPSAGLTQGEYQIVQSALGATGALPTPLPAPHVAPSTGQTASAKDGFYISIPTGVHFQVQGNKRYYITRPTVMKLLASHTKFTPILMNNPVFKLPSGGQI